VHIRRLGGVLEGDGARHTGVALTAPARTICTLSGVSSVTELVDDLATAHRRLATPVSVRHVAEASARFAGQSRLREALERAEGELNHSKLERLGRQLLAGIALLPHCQPFVVTDEGGFVALTSPFPTTGSACLSTARTTSNRIRSARMTISVTASTCWTGCWSQLTSCGWNTNRGCSSAR